MKSKRSRSSRSLLTLPSPVVAVAVGIFCIAYVQLSHSASITVSSSDSVPASSSSDSKQPSRISTLKANKPRVEVHVQPSRMKASDIKACISKAFCEVNTVSKMPNYAVNEEFFDLMNQIHAMSEEEMDSGSTSAEYDDDDDDDDDDDASSEESSSERLRGYPPPPPPPGFRYGKNMKDGTNATLVENNTSRNGTSTTTATPEKAKDATKKKTVGSKDKKTGKVNRKKPTKVSGTPQEVKVMKKFINGTLITVQKLRRSRVETEEEKAERAAYLTRKQREMGQVNDLAALIRISADIGLTLRNPRKCRTLFNKCTMSHEQVVDLFNQTLLAVTTPASNALQSSPVPTTKRAKVTTTTHVTSTSTDHSSTTMQEPILTKRPVILVYKPTSTSAAPSPPAVVTTPVPVTTPRPTTTTTDDGNRSSKSRHDFSDEDVEYLTDTEIQPVQTYALFVNDAPEDSVKTAEEINVQETFKKYANAFPADAPIPGNLPSLRKRSDKSHLKKHGSSSRSSTRHISKRRHTSSEEEEDDDDEEDDDAGSMSIEARHPHKSGFRVERPYQGYRGNKDDDIESAEPVSIPKESVELPPLVKKQKPKQKEPEEEEDEEDDSEESAEVADEVKVPVKTKVKSKLQSKKKVTRRPLKHVAAEEEEESSEEDDAETADDDQGPPQWTPVYQMYMTEKHKQGHKKKQKGPYKGGDYSDIQPHASSSHGSSSKKPSWSGHSSSHEMEAGVPSSHESSYGDSPFHQQGHHGGPPYGNMPLANSQETGGNSEQKPGFFQSIMSWFTGSNKNSNNDQTSAQHQSDNPYGDYGQHPYGVQPGSSEHLHHGHGHHEQQHDPSATGSPWPSQPDPAGVGHFGRIPTYRVHGYSSEEDEDMEEVLRDEPIVRKRQKKNKRRYRGRSDSIITSPPKKTTPTKKTTGPPPPVVIVPKDTKSSGIGAFEPNHNFEKLIQADGGITKKKLVSSDKENKRAKKAAMKPKSQQKKKSQKQKQRGQTHRTSRESAEDDDEAFSSEELYNQQVAKLKTGGAVTLGGSSSNGGSSTVANSNKSGNKQSEGGKDSSFPTYFESMFGTENKDKYQIKGKDDGSLLYGFESLSSHLSPAPIDLPALTANANKKKTSSYKVNKNKKKKGTKPPVKFNNKEVAESSEEEVKK